LCFLLEVLYYLEDKKLFNMKILAIETSCDDTSLAIFEDDILITLDTKSQIKIHASTGWVVPEVAAREHANAIFEVCENVLEKSKIKIEDIDYIAVTSHPWLIPSLLTGITFARTLSKIFQKPLLELNHIQGHIFSNFLERKKEDISFPLVCLTVSWWHNDIYYMSSLWEMEKIGSSQDDAAGESYDKVAKMMWLWYPGGPIISQLSVEYSQEKNKELFPRVWLKKDEFDFSFSWLKSAVKREIDKIIWLKWELD
jgi:N6-L-threonylcarbamoyladenine synthase